MLVIYDVNTNEFVSFAGQRPNGFRLPIGSKNIKPSEEMAENLSFFHIFDEKVMDQVFEMDDVGMTPTIEFDEDGRPIGIKRVDVPKKTTPIEKLNAENALLKEKLSMIDNALFEVIMKQTS